MYEVLIYKEGIELPKQGTYFVVAGNGLFMHKDTEILQCFVRVDNISCLDDLDLNQNIQMKLPKVPADIVWQIKEFFRLVVEKYHAESEVTLYFNPETNHYKVHVPQQHVTHASVRYKRVGTIHLEEMNGYLRVGTIHSHCDFGAFHSGTDIDDETDFDGIHITFGHNNKVDFSISTSLVINGHRKEVNSLEYIDGIEPVGEYFRLLPIDEQITEVFSLQVEQWLQNVNQNINNYESFSSAIKIVDEEDYVDWTDQVEIGHLRTHLGNGPYKVVGRISNRVIIQTAVGNANFPESFFRKVPT